MAGLVRRVVAAGLAGAVWVLGAGAGGAGERASGTAQVVFHVCPQVTLGGVDVQSETGRGAGGPSVAVEANVPHLALYVGVASGGENPEGARAAALRSIAGGVDPPAGETVGRVVWRLGDAGDGAGRGLRAKDVAAGDGAMPVCRVSVVVMVLP